MADALSRAKSVLLLGARQTGKSTLAARFTHQLALNFIRPDVRLRYEARPELLSQTLEALPRPNGRLPLVFFDEVQRLPLCLDIAQDAIDRGLAQFILTGSSARQLRHGNKVNLLPGRVVGLHLDPMTFDELPDSPLEDLLLDGSLPAVAMTQDPAHREADLRAYVSIYLDEEVRAEAMVRNLGKFSRFLELAALEAGNVVNFSRLSQSIGVAHTTIRAYYEILADCLLLERIEPISHSASRKKLTKASKYLLFDMGVRRICANEGRQLTPKRWGQFFEQWVGLELCRQARLHNAGAKVSFWRDPDGPEVDYVACTPGSMIPIEVKWTDAPQAKDIRHLQTFMGEYPDAKHAFVICRTPHRLALAPNITAIPWREVKAIWDA